VKVEAHKSSGIRELIKCLCDVFEQRHAVLCFPDTPAELCLLQGVEEWLSLPQVP